MIKKNNKLVLDDGSWWTFREDVSNLFDKHIAKSIPLYHQNIWITLELSDYFLRDDSNVYDLGSSTGTFLKSLQLRNKQREKIKYFGIDIVPEMIKHFQKNNSGKNIKFIHEDINKFKFKKSDLITSFYTLQFIEQRLRKKRLKNIYSSLNWGGAFLITEKIISTNSKNQNIMNEIYRQWEVFKGFSDKEVALKTKSLRGVLDPNLSKTNIKMLKEIGFKNIEIVSQYLNFQTILATK